MSCTDQGQHHELEQHLNSLLHDMVSKEKCAAFWQARWDEVAALLAPEAVLPGGQTGLPFAPVPRGAVTLAPLSGRQNSKTTRRAT